MINLKIIQALEPLNIPIYWMNYDGDDNEYIIFQTNSQNDIRFTDDTADERYNIKHVYPYGNGWQEITCEIRR